MTVEIQVVANDRAAKKSLAGINKSVGNIEKTANNVTKSLTRLAAGLTAAFAGSAITRSFNSAADSLTMLENRVALVTGRTEKMVMATEGLIAVARRSRGTIDGAGDTFMRFGQSLPNATMEELLDVTESVSKAMVISGASAESAKNTIIQLGQGMAAGALRGEELNSVLEQGPRLAMAIADEMGVGVGQLRALAQEGKITSEVVFSALINQAEQLDKEFETLTPTVAEAMSLMGDASTNFFGKLNKGLGTADAFAKRIIGLVDVLHAGANGAFDFGARIHEVFAVTNAVIRTFAIGVGMAFTDFRESLSVSTSLIREIGALLGGMALAKLKDFWHNFTVFGVEARATLLQFKAVGTDAFAAVLNSANSIWSGASTGMQRFKKTVEKTLKDIRDLLSGASYSEISFDFGGIFSNTLNKIVAVSATLWERARGGLTDFANKVKDLFWELYIWLVGNSVWPDTVRAIADWSGRLWELSKAGFIRFAEGAKSVFNSIATKLDLGSITSVGRIDVSSLRSTVGGYTEYTVTKLSTAYDSLSDSTKNSLTALTEFARAIGEEVIDVIVNAFSNSGASAIVVAVKGFGQKMFDAIFNSEDVENAVSAAISIGLLLALPLTRGIAKKFFVGLFSAGAITGYLSSETFKETAFFIIDSIGASLKGEDSQRKLLDAFTATFEGISSNMSEILKRIIAEWFGGVEFAESDFADLATNLTATAALAFGAAFLAISKVPGLKNQATKAGVASAGFFVIGILEGLATETLSGLKGVEQESAELVGDLLGGLTGGALTGAAAGSLAGPIGIIAGSVIGALIGAFVAVSGRLNEVIPALAQVVEGLWRAFEDQMQKLFDLVGVLVQKITETAVGIKDAAIELGKDIVEAIKDGIEQLNPFKGLFDKLAKLKAGLSEFLSGVGQAEVASGSRGRKVRRASGGFVSGPGTGTSDSIPAMLSNGEYVINAKSTAMYRPLLERLNRGQVGKFATGGFVGPGSAAQTAIDLQDKGGITGIGESVVGWWGRVLGQDLVPVFRELVGTSSKAEEIISNQEEAQKAANKAAEATNEAVDAASEEMSKAAEAAKEMAEWLKEDREQRLETLRIDAISSREVGNSMADNLMGSFQQGLASLLKGGSSLKDLGYLLFDQITGSVIDAFTSGLTNALFGQGGLDTLFSDFFGSIFGAGGSSGGFLGGLLGGGGGQSGGFLGDLLFGGSGSFFGFAKGGPVKKFSNGGPVFGAGTATSDSIPAMLSNGEYVINARSAAMHRPLLEKLNNDSRLAHFSTGGMVGTGGSFPKSGNTSPVVQEFHIKVEGDVSRQTRREVARMIPEIATGVNEVNRERGSM